jgi:hypothetical protein
VPAAPLLEAARRHADAVVPGAAGTIAVAATRVVLAMHVVRVSRPHSRANTNMHTLASMYPHTLPVFHWPFSHSQSITNAHCHIVSLTHTLTD